jgi:hypothetical protein
MTPPASPETPRLSGVGLGLRWDFLEEFLERDDVSVPFVEISPENYMRRGGYFPAALSRVGERIPVISHGLTLSVGGTDPMDATYLRELRTFVERVGAPYHTDHLCWSGTGEAMLHDLLPLPFTREAVRHVRERHARAQDALSVPLGLENITYYAPLGEPEMREEDFVAEVLDATGAALLLDVNNVYVNARNHGFDPIAWLEKMPLDRVVQLHVAGNHTWDDGMLVDTHGADVNDPVHELMAWVIERTGPKPVVLERDQLIPSLDELLGEVSRLQRTYDAAIAKHAAKGVR